MSGAIGSSTEGMSEFLDSIQAEFDRRETLQSVERIVNWYVLARNTLENIAKSEDTSYTELQKKQIEQIMEVGDLAKSLDSDGVAEIAERIIEVVGPLVSPKSAGDDDFMVKVNALAKSQCKLLDSEDQITQDERELTLVNLTGIPLITSLIAEFSGESLEEESFDKTTA